MRPRLAPLKLSLAAALPALLLGASAALGQTPGGAAARNNPHSPAGVILIALGVVLLLVVWWIRGRLVARAAAEGRVPEAGEDSTEEKP